MITTITEHKRNNHEDVFHESIFLIKGMTIRQVNNIRKHIMNHMPGYFFDQDDIIIHKNTMKLCHDQKVIHAISMIPVNASGVHVELDITAPCNSPINVYDCDMKIGGVMDYPFYHNKICILTLYPGESIHVSAKSRGYSNSSQEDTIISAHHRRIRNIHYKQVRKIKVSMSSQLDPIISFFDDHGIDWIKDDMDTDSILCGGLQFDSAKDIEEVIGVPCTLSDY